MFLVCLIFCTACKKKESVGISSPASGNCLPISRGDNAYNNYNLRIRYDFEGRPIKDSTYLGKMDYEVDSFFYDSKGLMIKSQYSRLSERYWTYYEYDPTNRLSRIKDVKDNLHTYITEFVYNPDNKPHKVIGYNEDSISTNITGSDEIKYDQKGNVSGLLHFDEKHNLMDSIVFEYDSKNGIYSSINLNYAVYRSDYDTWGPNNVIKKQIFYVKTPSDNRTTLYKYTYNANGFPTAVSFADATLLHWNGYTIDYNCK